MVTPYLVLVTSTVGRHEFTRRLRHGWPLQRLVSSANFHETGLRFSLACTSRQCNIRVAALGHIVVSVLDFCSRGQWTEAEDARCRLVRRNRHRRACAAGHARKDSRSSWDGFLFLGVVTRAGASIIVVGFNHCDRQVYLLRQISIVPRNRTYSSSNGVFILQDRLKSRRTSIRGP